MTRAQTTANSADLDRADSPHALIWFLVIDHPRISEPVRVVSDFYAYTLGGFEYVALPFEILPLTDTEQQPFAELRVQNVNRQIGRALETDMAARVRSLPPGWPRHDHDVICINGHPAPRALWPMIRPKPSVPGRPVEVTFHAPPMGGGGDGKLIVGFHP